MAMPPARTPLVNWSRIEVWQVESSSDGSTITLTGTANLSANAAATTGNAIGGTVAGDRLRRSNP